MSSTLIESSAKVAEPKEPSLLWAAASREERDELIKAAMLRLAYSLAGLKLYNIDTGEIDWFAPDETDTVTVPPVLPGGRYSPIYRIPPELLGLEQKRADIRRQSHSTGRSG